MTDPIYLSYFRFILHTESNWIFMKFVQVIPISETTDVMHQYFLILVFSKCFTRSLNYPAKEHLNMLQPKNKRCFLNKNKRTMMVLYRSPEHICNLYGLSRAGY